VGKYGSRHFSANGDKRGWKPHFMQATGAWPCRALPTPAGNNLLSALFYVALGILLFLLSNKFGQYLWHGTGRYLRAQAWRLHGARNSAA
jgi:hypothetical protein